MGLFGIFSSSTKTKSYYASKIADEERFLGQLKSSLECAKLNEKNFPVTNKCAIASIKSRIEQTKAHIASLKAEMKAAPKG